MQLFIIHLRQDFNEDDLFGESPAPALAQMMEVITTADQGLVKAIKNSGIIRWLLKFNSSLREEDLKKNVQDFVNNFLSVDSALALEPRQATIIEPLIIASSFFLIVRFI